MTGKTRRPIIAIVLVAAAALAGCGGVAEPDDALTGAVVLQATRAAETARTATTITMSIDKLSMTAEGNGIEDFTNQRGSMKLKAKSEGTFPFGEDEDASVRPEFEYEMRWFGDAVYVDMFSTLGMPGNKKWIKIDTGETAGEACVASSAAALGFGMGTPVNALDVLAANGNVLENLGTEVVRDEATTHWRIEDPKAPPGCDETFGRVVLELWTDTDKRARRILVTLDGTRSSGATTTTTPDWLPAMRMTMTTDYFDFGVPVSIEEPTKSEVADMNDAPLTDPKPADYGTPGSWTVAAEGVRDGTPWRVWTTKTSTGARCYDAENSLPGIGALPPEDDDAPKHDGRTSICDIGPESALAAFAGVRVIVDLTDGGQRTIVAEIADGSAELVFADGSTASMTVDPESHIAQWRGVPPTGVVKIKTETGTCQVGFDMSRILNPSKPDMNAISETLKDGDVPCIGSETSNAPITLDEIPTTPPIP